MGIHINVWEMSSGSTEHLSSLFSAFSLDFLINRMVKYAYETHESLPQTSQPHLLAHCSDMFSLLPIHLYYCMLFIYLQMASSIFLHP